MKLFKCNLIFKVTSDTKWYLMGTVVCPVTFLSSYKLAVIHQRMFCFVNVWNIDIFLCYLIIIKLISILLQIGTVFFILYLLSPLNYWESLLLTFAASHFSEDPPTLEKFYRFSHVIYSRLMIIWNSENFNVGILWHSHGHDFQMLLCPPPRLERREIILLCCCPFVSLSVGQSVH